MYIAIVRIYFIVFRLVMRFILITQLSAGANTSSD